MQNTLEEYLKMVISN